MRAELKKRGKLCTGCGACFNICPENAICMQEDEYGYTYAHISKDKCVLCNKCLTTCPVLQPPPRSLPLNSPLCYAAMANDDLRYNSSSGGAFSVFAQQILSQSGCVVGAALQDDLSVKHILISTLDDLSKLQKSKYVQSYTHYIYQEVKEKLLTGVKVLFSGCPCQVAALNSYLGKDYENLYTIDIFCHGVPSQKMLHDSLKEFTDIQPIKSLDFRDKSIGWDCLHLKLYYADNSSRLLSIDESRYEQGFHYNLTLRDSCYDCKFCDCPRQGDLSLGDFWGIENFDSSLYDNKGTSLILVNTEKGKDLFENFKKEFYQLREVPFEYAANNRIHPKCNIHPKRDYFLRLYPQRPFNQSVLFASQNRFDIGLVGNWSYPNYGSELTYYALYALLQSWGKSVLMISWPKSSKWAPYDKPQLFNSNPYPDYAIAPLVDTRHDLSVYNQNCDIFIQGSDQLFNNNLYNWFDKFMQLDWVQDNKKKIAYAASFGADYIWGSDDDRAELSYFMQKFDYFSVREDSGIDIAHKYYNVTATTVLDPVFLVQREQYQQFMATNSIDVSEKKYLFAYTLNPNKEKSEALLFSAQKLGLSILAAGDGAIEKQETTNIWGIQTTYGLSVEQWLSHLETCEFIITDSFHGTCFAIIFQKPFISICNSERGSARFSSLLNMLGLENRLINSELDLLNRPDLLESPIDYSAVVPKLDAARSYSLKWLENTLQSDSRHLKPLSTFDLMNKQYDNLHNSILEIKTLNSNEHEEYIHSLNKTNSDLRELSAVLDHTGKDLIELDANYKALFGQIFNEINSKLNSLVDTMHIEHSSLQETFLLEKNITENSLSQIQTQTADTVGRVLEKLEKISTDINDSTILITNLQDELTSFKESQLQYNRFLDTLYSVMSKQIVDVNQKLNEIQESKTYLIGRIITWLPRKIIIFFKNL